MFDGAAGLAADCARQRRPELLTPVDPNPAPSSRSATLRVPDTGTHRRLRPRAKMAAQISEQRQRRSPRRRGTAEIIDDQTDWQNLMTIIPKEALGALLTQATRVCESAILAPFTRTGSSLCSGAGSHSQSQCQGLRSRPLIGRRCCTRP